MKIQWVDFIFFNHFMYINDLLFNSAIKLLDIETGLMQALLKDGK